MTLRMGAWLGALALVTVWWFVSLVDPPTARERAQTPPTESTSTLQNASAFSERLKRGMAERPSAPSPRRNPFTFGEREPAPPPVSEAPPVALPPAPVTTPPAFTLAGIGSSDTPDGVLRTAVLSTGRGVILAKPGDDLPNGMRVVRVDEDHIVIADAAGVETILRLK